MNGRVEATVPLLLALLALSLAACARGTQDAEDRIRFERNNEIAGPHLQVFLTLTDGSEASVNTADDAIGTRPGETPIPGHMARDWNFLKDAETGTTFAHALVSWDVANPADYLIAGWWIPFLGQHLPDLSFADTVQYRIVDGPEIDSTHPQELPPAGKATYSGDAGGVYTYVPKGDWDATVVDEFRGTITLSADFDRRTLSGCIGCVGDLSTRRAHFGVIPGNGVRDDRSLIADYELRLSTATKSPEGTFETDGITVTHPGRTQVSSEASWGGQLSSIPNGDDVPRLVTGFSSVDFAESDGSEALIAEAFVAPADRSDDP